MHYDKQLSYIFTTIDKSMPGLSRIFLFGSRARGDNKPYSDFDIGIESKEGLGRKQIEDLKELFIEFPYVVDIVDFGAVSKEFVIEATKDIITYTR